MVDVTYPAVIVPHPTEPLTMTPRVTIDLYGDYIPQVVIERTNGWSGGAVPTTNPRRLGSVVVTPQDTSPCHNLFEAVNRAYSEAFRRRDMAIEQRHEAEIRNLPPDDFDSEGGLPVLA